MRTIEHCVDFCVVGGGIAGLCAAVAAARLGIRTAIMQDRPMFGGNASSEIRMCVCGAHGKDNREGGIVEELMLENFYRNPGLKYPIWDTVLFEKALLEPNLTMFLNCSCLDAKIDGGKIENVTGWQLTTQTFHRISAKFFADCSGDSILAPLAHAEFTVGREARSQYNEDIEPVFPDKKTMGMSCIIQARETTEAKKFVPPSWAHVYETDQDLPEREHCMSNTGNNFWWIELGGDMDSIHDTEEIRDELLKTAYGVWDHIKNRGDHNADRWELEWIGMLPGKRESRRYIGSYVVTQNDVEDGGRFDDIVAYAGWTMDDHFPEGFHYKDGHPTIYHPAPSPWGIPFRSLYSKNIKNLFFAGRNISVSHAALSSSRVMSTCGIIGQAVGTAAAILCKNNLEIPALKITELQQTLLFYDCYLPGKPRIPSALTQKAFCSNDIVRNGNDRCDENCWIGKDGDFIEYRFNQPEPVRQIRLIFDSNLNRPYHNLPAHCLLDEPSYFLPIELIKDYEIVIEKSDGSIYTERIVDNHQRFRLHHIDQSHVLSVKLIPLTTWGCSNFHVFSFELY